MTRRTNPLLLPESCYNFFAKDGRDGETFGPYAKLATAQRQLARLRDTVPNYNRRVFYLEWFVSERKVLATFRPKARR